ncbi:hypothetical protein BCR44DRAFT_70103 [Catenaria anguillulae PL171]|uniref:Uncharacterized protein n=1 Tax=Catenaria anguillulae PL171 TaxID=765915 RepID=A0A1Y2HHJ5_9FUNG|nr:hypothetical protein BCR44DRAFT_70103 [Catenaria anguillulae PL171]
MPFSSSVFGPNGLASMRQGPLGPPFRRLTDVDGELVTRSPSWESQDEFAQVPTSQMIAQVLQSASSFGYMSSMIEIVPHVRYHLLIGGHVEFPRTALRIPCFGFIVPERRGFIFKNARLELEPNPNRWITDTCTDMLWAVWQYMDSSNLNNLETVDDQLPIEPSDPVPEYEDLYTARDMLNFYTRLCYVYQTPLALPPSSMRRRDAVQHNKTAAATTAKTRPKSHPHAPFRKLARLDNTKWKMWMPNISMEAVRKAEEAYDDLVDKTNAAIQEGKMKLQDLKTIKEYWDAMAKNRTASNDDCQDTAIPAVKAQRSQSMQQMSASSSANVMGSAGAFGIGLGALMLWLLVSFSL